jgi:hypothetical protein
MKSYPVVSVCIQAEPNALGLDFGRIEMTAEVIKALRRLHFASIRYQLFTISAHIIPIKWYKNGVHQTEVETCLVDFLGDGDCFCLYVEYCHSRAIVDGVSSSTLVSVRGSWFAEVEELTLKRLAKQADEYGDIHAHGDVTTDLEIRSRAAELKHSVLQERIRRSQCVPYIASAPAWPDPFDCWPVKNECFPQVHRRVPARFIRASRSRQASDMLGMLFFVALKKRPDPNERCAIYTLAAAIIICPDEVELTQIVESDAPPIFNRSCELEPLGEWPLTDDYLSALGQICRDTGKHFERPNRKVRIRYKTLMGVLNVDRFNCDTTWTTHTSHSPNLALLYEDHTNNEAAKYWLNEHQRVNRADHPRLILLAYGLDLLKRQLVDGQVYGLQPWWEDMRNELEGIAWYDNDLSKIDK